MPDPDWNTLFAWSNRLAFVGWLILILAPRRIAWLFGLPRLAIPVALSVAYTVLVAVHFFRVEGGGFGSIAAVRALFLSDPVLLAGWQHYLAFDLFVGAWCAARLDAAGVHRLLQAPLLLTVFMVGPAGFVLSLATAHLTERLRGLAGAAALPARP